MKKILFIPALLCATLSHAQNTESTQKKNPNKLNTLFYVGLGVQVQDKLNINDKINAVNLPEINSARPELYVGINMLGKKYNSDLELSTAYSNVEKMNVKNDYLNTTFRIRFHYNIADKKNTLLSAGLNLGIAGSSVNLYANNNTIDLNNLSNTSNLAHINLRSTMLFAGPSVSFWVLRKAQFPLRLNVGYEIGLTRGRWNSDYTQVNNTVGEFGKNRLLVGLTLM